MRRHDTDPVSFAAGLLFLAVAWAYLLPEVSDYEVTPRWVLPGLLLGLGGCGLLAAVTRRPGARAAAVTSGPATAGPDTDTDAEPDWEPYPDLTLDLAEELTRIQPTAPTPDPAAPSEGSAQHRSGGAHAIGTDGGRSGTGSSSATGPSRTSGTSSTGGAGGSTGAEQSGGHPRE